MLLTLPLLLFFPHLLDGRGCVYQGGKGYRLGGAEGGLGRAALRTALRMEDQYVVSQLPSAMEVDVHVPRELQCGSQMLEADLWISAGNATSLLHKDADHALNCLLVGQKDWLFIEPRYEVHVPMATEPYRELGGFALLDPDRVDLDRFPDLRLAQYLHASLGPGDCIVVPSRYLHHVYSPKGRNLAVSLLFSINEDYAPEDCTVHDPLPLHETRVHWRYDGLTSMTMGNSDPVLLRKTVGIWLGQSHTGAEFVATFAGEVCRDLHQPNNRTLFRQAENQARSLLNQLELDMHSAINSSHVDLVQTVPPDWIQVWPQPVNTSAIDWLIPSLVQNLERTVPVGQPGPFQHGPIRILLDRSSDDYVGWKKRAGQQDSTTRLLI